MRRRLVQVEALVLIALSTLMIALLPFRRVAALAARRPGTRPAPTAQALRVRRAVETSAARLPWDALCFERGLAAQLMLHRRGFAASLFYGACRDETGALVAHVWVRSGDVDVIGCDRLDRFGLLGVFPASEG
jgi:hypothetical protein